MKLANKLYLRWLATILLQMILSSVPLAAHADLQATVKTGDGATYQCLRFGTFDSTWTLGASIYTSEEVRVMRSALRYGNEDIVPAEYIKKVIWGNDDGSPGWFVTMTDGQQFFADSVDKIDQNNKGRLTRIAEIGDLKCVTKDDALYKLIRFQLGGDALTEPEKAWTAGVVKSISFTDKPDIHLQIWVEDTPTGNPYLVPQRLQRLEELDKDQVVREYVQGKTRQAIDLANEVEAKGIPVPRTVRGALRQQLLEQLDESAEENSWQNVLSGVVTPRQYARHIELGRERKLIIEDDEPISLQQTPLTEINLFKQLLSDNALP